MRRAFQGNAFEAAGRTRYDAVDALLVRHFAVHPDEANPNELPDAPVLR